MNRLKEGLETTCFILFTQVKQTRHERVDESHGLFGIVSVMNWFVFNMCIGFTKISPKKKKAWWRLSTTHQQKKKKKRGRRTRISDVLQALVFFQSLFNLTYFIITFTFFLTGLTWNTLYNSILLSFKKWCLILFLVYKKRSVWRMDRTVKLTRCNHFLHFCYCHDLIILL